MHRDFSPRRPSRVLGLVRNLRPPFPRVNLIYVPQAHAHPPPPPPYFPKSDDRPRFSPASRVYRLPRFISSSRSARVCAFRATPSGTPRITVEYRRGDSPSRLFFSNEWIRPDSVCSSTFLALENCRVIRSRNTRMLDGNNMQEEGKRGASKSLFPSFHNSSFLRFAHPTPSSYSLLHAP